MHKKTWYNSDIEQFPFPEFVISKERIQMILLVSYFQSVDFFG